MSYECRKKCGELNECCGVVKRFVKLRKIDKESRPVVAKGGGKEKKKKRRERRGEKRERSREGVKKKVVRKVPRY
jgi:hypothetical protein